MVSCCATVGEQSDASGDGVGPLPVYGHAAYGAGALLSDLEDAGAQIMTKVQPPAAPGGRFTSSLQYGLPAGLDDGLTMSQRRQ